MNRLASLPWGPPGAVTTVTVGEGDGIALRVVHVISRPIRGLVPRRVLGLLRAEL